MTWTDKTAFTGEAAAFAGELHDKLAALPSLALSTLDSESTALFVVDMVEGFARQGAMASPRVEALIAPSPPWRGGARRRAFRSWPLQTRTRRTAWSFRPIPRTACAAPKRRGCARRSRRRRRSIRYSKRTRPTGSSSPVFELWRREHATATTYLVTGDCTDICVLQFVLSAKAWHNTRNLPLRILVPTALTDTFDAPGHPADTLGAAALYLMEAAGAELYGDVV